MTDKELMKKAQELIGSWIYDKIDSDEYLYAYDCYDWVEDGDVKLCCIAICSEDSYKPYVQEKEIWMSEFDEYYRKVSDTKCIKEWEKIKKYYDKIFKGSE